MEDISDENRLTLGGLAKSGISRFRYTYDFGDDWEHEVLIEKIPPKVPGGDGVSRLCRRQAELPAGGLWRRVRL